MNIIVCLDDNNGMLFNKRRLSSDILVTKRILYLAKSSRLWMNEYSSKLFENSIEDFFVDDDFIHKALEGDYCFVENIEINNHLDDVEQIIIYRWNRKYPSDLKFPTEQISKKWKLCSTYEFAGKSHTKITEEIYEL